MNLGMRITLIEANGKTLLVSRVTETSVFLVWSDHTYTYVSGVDEPDWSEFTPGGWTGLCEGTPPDDDYALVCEALEP